MPEVIWRRYSWVTCALVFGRTLFDDEGAPQLLRSRNGSQTLAQVWTAMKKLERYLRFVGVPSASGEIPKLDTCPVSSCLQTTCAIRQKGPSITEDARLRYIIGNGRTRRTLLGGLSFLHNNINDDHGVQMCVPRKHYGNGPGPYRDRH